MYWKKIGLLTLVYQNPPSRTHSISPLISSKQSSSRLANNMTVTDEWISISGEKNWRSRKGGWRIGDVREGRLGLKIGRVDLRAERVLRSIFRIGY